MYSITQAVMPKEGCLANGDNLLAFGSRPHTQVYQDIVLVDNLTKAAVRRVPSQKRKISQEQNNFRTKMAAKTNIPTILSLKSQHKHLCPIGSVVRFFVPSVLHHKFIHTIRHKKFL